MIEPHGGRLVNRIASEARVDQLQDRLSDSPMIDLTGAEYQDAINIATGRFSPLNGFMSRSDFLKVIHDMTLEDGTRWTLPVTLGVDSDAAADIIPGEYAGLVSPDGTLVGSIDVTEVYGYNAEETARLLYDTDDHAHPGVRTHLRREEFFVGGQIDLFREPRHTDFDLYPAESRVLFREKGWDTVIGFQTRNAPHRAHEYIQKSALELGDGLLIQPKLGHKKAGDYRDEVIMDAYRELIEHYYVSNRVVLSAFPSQMRYAGPREAIFDAIVRKNQGCTHFVVGRDHAGVEDYYDGFDAHQIFEDMGDVGIIPLFYNYSFYCKRCDGMASEKICPHEDDDRVYPSGTRIRELIDDGTRPPPEMMRPEVANHLQSVDEPFVDETGVCS